ncbi:MAG TPA: amidohydrolase family protein [Vicinamibacterales bacterium]|nr:amidohydrolase family protein [Vicinamibacterales bacterium]
MTLTVVMINDSHCHFFSSSFLERLAPSGGGAGALAARLGWEPPGTPPQLADRWIAELDRHGVSRIALIASIPGDEAAVAEAVARHPQRFAGFFMFNPAAPDADAALRRAFVEYRMRAVCLFPAMHGYRLDDECVERVFGAAAEHGGTVFAHCGVLTVGVRKRLGLPSRFDLRLGDPLTLAKTALGFPGVPVIVPHFGAGFFREALIAADQCATIHFDTSSANGWTKFHPDLLLEDVFRHTLSVAGVNRILFGTDSSFFPRGWLRDIYESQERTLEKLGVAPADRELVFGRNFDRLFPV